MTGLPEKIVGLHQAFARAELPHAFGGALALAWCTQRARGTVDIDVNVFVGGEQSDALLQALPKGVSASSADESALAREGQVRLWWDGTPLDLFLNTTPFHDDAMRRIRWERFAGHELPFLSCHDIAVFKAFFDRTRDWADLEDMYAAGTLDVERVTAVIIHYLGFDDGRVAKLRALAAPATRA